MGNSRYLASQYSTFGRVTSIFYIIKNKNVVSPISLEYARGSGPLDG